MDALFMASIMGECEINDGKVQVNKLTNIDKGNILGV